jgi:hypothetical protein
MSGSITLLVDNIDALVLPLVPTDPIALKGGQTGDNTTPNPAGINPFVISDHLDPFNLSVGRCDFPNFT